MSRRRFRKYSYLSLLLIALTCIQFRAYYSDISGKRELSITTWDALGYYIYLPAIFIYEDYKTYEWFPEMDEKYNLSGGWVYQLSDLENGNKVGKYLGGVAILQAPFFAIGHVIALNTDYPADGFSAPYQYALGFGVILWFLLGLIILYKVLRVFFSETVAAWTLAMLVLATNAVQYVSVDNAMSHGYIFTLYAMLLFATVQWHANPKRIWAFTIGAVIGLACISRPTELIMVLIPILWFTQNKANSKKKWALVWDNKSHILFLALGGISGVLPQIIYWKQVTGSFIYDVGSKWDFLLPHIRILFWSERGLFVYTPVAIPFIVGMFIAKKRQYPFRKSVIWFGLINLWIITAWHDWMYGATYSMRALVQSYPVYALPLAVCIQEILLWRKKYWKWAAGVVAFYLVFVNLFQTWQYNETILHYSDMNWRYYRAIYLDPSPSALDMSLLDTDEVDELPVGASSPTYSRSDEPIHVRGGDSLRLGSIFIGKSTFLDTIELFKNIRPIHPLPDGTHWIHVGMWLKGSQGLWDARINAKIGMAHAVKWRSFRAWSPITKPNENNYYEFVMKVPDDWDSKKRYFDFSLWLKAGTEFEGEIKSLSITYY